MESRTTAIRGPVSPLRSPALQKHRWRLHQRRIAGNCELSKSQRIVHLLLRDDKMSKITRAMPSRWLTMLSCPPNFLGVKFEASMKIRHEERSRSSCHSLVVQVSNTTEQKEIRFKLLKPDEEINTVFSMEWGFQTTFYNFSGVFYCPLKRWSPTRSTALHFSLTELTRIRSGTWWQKLLQRKQLRPHQGSELYEEYMTQRRFRNFHAIHHENAGRQWVLLDILGNVEKCFDSFGDPTKAAASTTVRKEDEAHHIQRKNPNLRSHNLILQAGFIAQISKKP